MKYLMKKEAKDLMLTGVLEAENPGALTAAAHSFLCALESRCKDRKTDHFLWLLISPCASGSLLFLWDCCCITKMCSFYLLTHPCFLNLADPYALTFLILLLYYGTDTVLCSNTFPSSLQLSPIFSHCFGDPVVFSF